MTTPVRRYPPEPDERGLMPCGTRSAAMRHRAQGESCRACWPDGGPGPVTG